VKSGKAKLRAEEANKLKTKMNKSKHKLRQVQNLKIRLFQIIPFTVLYNKYLTSIRATQQLTFTETHPICLHTQIERWWNS